MNQSSFTVADLIAMRDKSVSAAFMDFNHAVVCNPDALFVFYEGQDNDYYYVRQYIGFHYSGSEYDSEAFLDAKFTFMSKATSILVSPKNTGFSSVSEADTN